MPDVREVYEMVTKQKPPEPGALERQQRRQVRTARNRKIGAFVVAAAIGLAAVVLILVNLPGSDTATTPADPPPPPLQADAAAVEVATGFVQAVGAFDADRAVGYLTDFAEVPEGLAPEELPRLISLYEALGYEQMLDPCEVTGTSASGTAVRCPFDFHSIRSDEIGRGPYHGSYWDITVIDGKISSAIQSWEIEKFSPQMWEPFSDWVAETHPKDFEVMYTGGATNFRISEESIQLWEQNSKEYVKEVNRGNAE
jgi:hypothetical protein